MKEYTITDFARHIGLTKQAVDQSIKENRFSHPGYRLEKGEKRTKIIKVDRMFIFDNPENKIYVIVKAESPELATLFANDYLFEKQMLLFRFKLNDACEIEENEVLISNL